MYLQGAVMLLFEGACGRVLHTGDFRYHPFLARHNVAIATM